MWLHVCDCDLFLQTVAWSRTCDWVKESTCIITTSPFLSSYFRTSTWHLLHEGALSLGTFWNSGWLYSPFVVHELSAQKRFYIVQSYMWGPARIFQVWMCWQRWPVLVANPSADLVISHREDGAGWHETHQTGHKCSQEFIEDAQQRPRAEPMLLCCLPHLSHPRATVSPHINLREGWRR